jgi:outer membrane protein assembly factor BamA
MAARVRADDGIGTQREISDMIPEHHESTELVRIKNWAVLPEVGYSPDQMLNGGFKFTGRDLTDYDLTIDAELNAAMGHQLGADAAILAPHLLDRRAINLDEYHYYLSPEKDFFGIGNNHVRSPLSVHSIERQRALFTFAYHLTHDLVVGASAGPRQTRIYRDVDSSPSIPSTLDAFPRLSGISGGRTNPLIASLIYNNRESITRPTQGWSAIGTIEHVNQNLANDFHFTRYTADASYLHPLTSRNQILGLHLGGEYISGNGRQIPFFELASMGGSNDMRGFFPDRFLGTSRFTINSEYRAKAAGFNFMHLWDVQIDGVLFGDMGQIFISDSDLSHEFRVRTAHLPGIFEEFRYSYGTGLRIAIGEAILARLDVGFSNEQTGLVYLVFGHTF